MIVCALLVGAAAPARAWCETTCLAPAEQTEPHCRTSDPADGTTSISADVLDECPVLESARPSVAGRLDVNPPLVTGYLLATLPRTHVTPSLARPHSQSDVLERFIPLRI